MPAPFQGADGGQGGHPADGATNCRYLREFPQLVPDSAPFQVYAGGSHLNEPETRNRHGATDIELPRALATLLQQQPKGAEPVTDGALLPIAGREESATLARVGTNQNYLGHPARTYVLKGSPMSEMTFTFHAPRETLAIAKSAANALITDGESRILIFGNELNADERAALTAAFATDGGTVVLSDDAPVSKCKSAIGYALIKSKRKGVFARITANTPEAPTVAYVVGLKPKA